MGGLYGLLNAVQATFGTQQRSWKQELLKTVMEDVYRYVDAACTPSFASQELVAREQDVQATLQALLSVIPESKPES